MAMVPHVSQNFTVCFLLLSIVTIQSRNHFTEQETQFASGRKQTNNSLHHICYEDETRRKNKMASNVTDPWASVWGRCCSTSPSHQEEEPTNRVLQQKFLQPKWSSLYTQCCAIARSSRTTLLKLERKTPKWGSCKFQQLLET